MSVPAAHEPYNPADVFALDERVLAAPGRYVQGAGVLDRLGRYLRAACGPAMCRVAVLVSSGGLQRPEGARALASLAAAGVAHTQCVFGGECTDDEIARHVAAIGRGDSVQALVAIGGGKCLDAGRCIAGRLCDGDGVPFVACPTLASTNAACSACSVVYAALGGRTLRDEYFRASPALVLVDTLPILRAHPRYLAAGMGDAVAAAFEARAMRRSAAAGGGARTESGGRSTLAARALADTASAILMQHGASTARRYSSGVFDWT